jgi:hypothetical protein
MAMPRRAMGGCRIHARPPSPPGSFDEGDMPVADRFYGSFMMLALLPAHGVDGCVRMHQRRHTSDAAGVHPAN